MANRITVTEAVTLLAWDASRTAGELLAEACTALENWRPGPEQTREDFDANLFGGKRSLDEAADLILEAARNGRVPIFGRRGAKDQLAPRTCISEEDLHECITFNTFRTIAPSRTLASRTNGRRSSE